MSLLSEAQANFENLSIDELKAHLTQVAAAQAKQRERQKEYNASPEAKAQRKEYQTKRLADIKGNPEEYAKLQAKRKEYMNRPDVKAKRQEYHKKRNAELKALVEIAKAKGIDVDAILKSAAATPASQPTA